MLLASLRSSQFGVAPSWATLTLHLGFNRSNDGDLNFSASNHYVFPSLDHDKNLAAFSGKVRSSPERSA